MKNLKKGSALIVIIIAIVVLVVGFLSYAYFQGRKISIVDNAEVVSFANYDRNNFVPYTQSQYYSFNYPKGWIIKEIKGQGTALDSFEIVSPTEDKESVHLGASFIYGTVSPDKQDDYFEIMIRERTKKYPNSQTIQNSHLIVFNDIPRVYILTESKENDVNTKSVNVVWFVKPDPKGRDSGGAFLMMSVSYRAPTEEFSEEILNGVMDSVDENAVETFFNSR